LLRFVDAGVRATLQGHAPLLTVTIRRGARHSTRACSVTNRYYSQGCAPLYKGMLCNECIRGFYLSGGTCGKCPPPEAYATILALVIFAGGALGYLWAKYGDAIELMFDPGTIKIVISYLMVTGSVNSSVNMPPVPGSEFLTVPPEISAYLQFDPTGVMFCLIQAFEYTFYHNVVVMAMVPYMLTFFFKGLTDVATAIIKVNFQNKRKIAQDEEEEEALNEEEGAAIYELGESLMGMRSEIMIFLHPNITDVMFGLLDCGPILGYDNTWLASDYRFQCNDFSYFLFFFIGVYTVITFSIGLPVYYLVTLRRRRHKLDEAKAVVIKRYTAWRAHLKRAADLRIPEEDMAGAEELVKVDADILFMHTQYQVTCPFPVKCSDS